MPVRRVAALMVLLCLVPAAAGAQEPPAAGKPRDLFARDNLVAWCIVPFDAKNRTPARRAEMLDKLNLHKFAYDWRAQHLPTLEDELAELKKHKIELTAFWFPGSLNKDARFILDTLKKHSIKTQLWVTIGVKADPDPKKMVESAAAAVKPIAGEAAKIGCTVALYNHGGWFGDPENQIAIIERLKQDGVTNVGIVYNQHHGHDHLARFPELLAKMKPYLVCLNLNGMTREGEKAGKKILPIGQGELDLELLKTIRASGYAGPIGILNHTPEDAEARLQDNLEGLEWLVRQLDGKDPGKRPTPRSYKPAPAPQPAPGATRGPFKTAASLDKPFGRALVGMKGADGGLVVDSKDAYRLPPITVECRALLRSKDKYNILVASDSKRSGQHWEVFTVARSGVLCAYLPGYAPDHVRSTVDVCDGKWHHVAFTFEPGRLRLFLDGKPVAEQAVKPKPNAAPMPAGLAFGRLVEGGIGCDGLIDDVRISRGVRDVFAVPTGPLKADETTLGLWDFEDPAAAIYAPFVEPVGDAHPSAAPTLPGGEINHWAVEDAKARAALPLYQTIPAATPEELTPANAWPPPADYAQWYRSHGNHANTRYSPLAQVNKSNVKALKVAWVYHTDNKANVQCNPIVVDGVMYAPTPNYHVVAVNAVTGREIWRFKPGGRPAHRGLTFWPGDPARALGPRLLFPSGDYLWALDPKTGKPIDTFGEAGKSKMTHQSVVAPAVYKDLIIFCGWDRDVYAHDMITGKPVWTFHTVPQKGEEFADTWDRPDQGANCWGGTALDASRGIFYFTTGSPKPNFVGVNHLGDNLFSDCVVALEATTGKRLWHFQEIRHDIWDLDIPAPPILVTVDRAGKKVDAVAGLSKIGNTLLLDRVTGKPLFPFRLKRAPASRLPGERTAPYQPDVQLPEPFARQVFTEDDVTEVSDAATTFILDKIADAKYGWFEPFDEGRPLAMYGFHGGAEWTGGCFDPATGLLYVSSNEIPWMPSVHRNERPAVDETKLIPTPGRKVYVENCMPCHGPSREGLAVNPSLLGLSSRLKEADVLKLLDTGRGLMPVAPQVTAEQRKVLIEYLFDRDRPQAKTVTARPERPRYRDGGYPKLLDEQGYPGCQPPWGNLVAVNLNTGRIAWKVPLGEYEELLKKGHKPTGTENFGGPVVTAGGLVFCAGTRDHLVRAFDKDTGAELWRHKLPYVGCAPPTVYQAGGKQYLLIPSFGGGKLATPMGDSYIAFALP